MSPNPAQCAQCMIITYLKTGKENTLRIVALRPSALEATILNVFSFPCFEVRGNSIVSQQQPPAGKANLKIIQMTTNFRAINFLIVVT